MAAYHTRSISFPSSQHPLIPEFDEQLCRLRSSEAASSSSTSLSSKVSGLQDLHDCVDKLLLLPLNQQALSKQPNEEWVDELLDGSLRLLDMCNTAKDALQQTKESTQELQSIIRRRRGGESSLSCEVKKFLNIRKAVKKALHEAMENKCTFSLLNQDQEIVSMLREVQSITLAVFESMFSFISGPKSNSWSLVSKLMNSKKASCENVNKSNEFVNVDAALNSLLISNKSKKSDSMLEENAQNELQKLEMCIQDLEEGVESLYRRLLKTRVSLLNILSH
ncbi:hypothetical protein L484_014369 [Morus notabilis]|uniref:DUF241 domain-containing protein n=1 Tax=Morus notabilis TaxID=981085 RepID=W9RTQ6_9ROSA|nr:uncharacterized protein LOC21397512 [Morus notabilis]EXB95396.1 hypothetical protein L484_014369 [Morus notabilis]